jgi:hypothetical protein
MSDSQDEREYETNAAEQSISPLGVAAPGPGMTPMPLPMGGMMSPGGFGMPGEYAFDAWNYRPDVDPNDLAGCRVEATDGGVGKVDKVSHTTDDGYLVVDTGPWIFGRKVVLPAGTVNHVDRVERVVYLDRTRDQVKASPEVDADALRDAASRDGLRDYYHRTYDAG